MRAVRQQLSSGWTPRYPPGPVTAWNCEMFSPEILKCCPFTSETMTDLISDPGRRTSTDYIQHDGGARPAGAFSHRQSGMLLFPGIVC